MDNQRSQQNQQPGMTRAQAAQMIRLQRQANTQRGCLLGILTGGWYWVWLSIKLCWRLATWPFRLGARVGWDVVVKWPVQATVAACRWTGRGLQAATPWAVRGGQAFTARYGAKGWYVVGGAVVVLAILGAIIR